jgi:hypothetical protein
VEALPGDLLSRLEWPPRREDLIFPVSRSNKMACRHLIFEPVSDDVLPLGLVPGTVRRKVVCVEFR